MINTRYRPFAVVFTLGIVIPLALLLCAQALPSILDRIAPVYQLTATPNVVRTGQHIVFTEPVRKNWNCTLTATPFAVFTYVDATGTRHVASFEQRNVDRQVMPPHTVMFAGEKAVLGPFVLFVTQEVTSYASEFYLEVPCSRPYLGSSHTRIGPFPIPLDSKRDGAAILQDFSAVGAANTQGQGD